MFFKTNPTDTSSLDDQINTVLSSMKNHAADTAEFDKLLGQLERLYKLKIHNPTGFKPSADAILSVAGSLVGILLITKYETLNVITSKAMSFIPKLIK